MRTLEVPMGEENVDDDEDTEGAVHVIHAMQPGEDPQRQSLLKTLHLQPVLRPTPTKVFAYGLSTPLPLTGVLTMEISHDSHSAHAKVYITKNSSGILLSCHTVERLHLVTFVFSVPMRSIEDLLTEFARLFQGIGCLKDRPIHLHIDESIQLIALKHCRVAFHLHPKVENELSRTSLKK
ncbi:hypothetical protein NDU88_001396 [Pleurodeles waltl]|uniref:Uncharacterized protein n=1 Tax=Pleurodeles waltl TaxID=8319 RepID=A0AAV7NCA8_PLEWA|nr:hypothetical protein NDU88_001396 [Pleurodeles waltl]